MIVKRVKAQDTYLIRHKQLRPDKDLKACEFIGDHDESSFHLGVFLNGRLLSVASFFFDKHPQLNESENQYRLRGMATLPEFQGQGFGSALIKTALPLIKQNQCDSLWCNARKHAVGFYEKIGFEVLSSEFDIPEVGPHYLMNLKIN
jgi:ribosomal protein S18 acetylase RimI-like enzyme